MTKQKSILQMSVSELIQDIEKPKNIVCDGIECLRVLETYSEGVIVIGGCFFCSERCEKGFLKATKRNEL